MWTNVGMILADFSYEVEDLLGYGSWIAWMMVVSMVINYIIVPSMNNEKGRVELDDLREVAAVFVDYLIKALPHSNSVC